MKYNDKIKNYVFFENFFFDEKISMTFFEIRNFGDLVIFTWFSIENQVKEVDRVKRSESGMIQNPVTISSNKSIKDAMDIMKHFHISDLHPGTFRNALYTVARKV